MKPINGLEELIQEITKQHLAIASAKDIPKDKSDWINPFSEYGPSPWKIVTLQVLNKDRSVVTASYHIHSDSEISVINHTLDKLINNPDDMLMMIDGPRGGDTLTLHSYWREQELPRAISGFYFYRIA